MGWTEEENETFMVLLEKFPAEKVQVSFPKRYFCFLHRI